MTPHHHPFCAFFPHTASDGIWDLWEYEDVFQGISSPPDPKIGQSTDKAMAFFSKSVTQGAEMFEDTADNMTGMVVYLNPKGTKEAPSVGGAKSGKPATPKPSEDSSRFSV